MSQLSRRLACTALFSLFAAATVGGAWANESQWDKRHPRRAQVNERLERQNQRIREERKEGEISKQQAQQLHQQDRAIRQEERAMARQHGGHITRAEQKLLNQQENAVSRQIGK